MDFSIVTPSRNMLTYLKRCSASILDQEGVSVEHIVADAVSNDGTVEWLRANPNVTAMVQKDEGMYDAINKGIEKAQGDFIAYLNCDEQYLPGTLAEVKKAFDRNPQSDIVFGDTLLVRPDGTLISFRKTYPLRAMYLRISPFYVTTCSLFFRRRIFDQGFSFDKKFRDSGDKEFMIRLLDHGYRSTLIRRYLSTFTMTGNNMSTQSNAEKENRELRNAAPAVLKLLRWPLTGLRLLEKFAHGGYFTRFPIHYQIYISSELTRDHFTAHQATYRWQNN